MWILEREKDCNVGERVALEKSARTFVWVGGSMPVYLLSSICRTHPES
jgi:hypothetical protein